MRRYLPVFFACLWLVGVASAQVSAVSVSPTFTLTITPLVGSIPLTLSSFCTGSASPFSCATGALGVNDANMPLAVVNVVSNPPGATLPSATLSVSGPQAANFLLANPVAGCSLSGGNVVCTNLPTVAGGSPIATLTFGAANVPAGTYTPTLTVQ